MKLIAQVTSGGDAKLDQLQTFLRDTSEAACALDCSVLVRPEGTLFESDSLEMAERSISIELKKSVASRVESRLTNSILGFLLFARVPARTRTRSSPILTALGEPINEYRLDCISTWLVNGNAQYARPEILQCLVECLRKEQTFRVSKTSEG
jgi:hypothetical protein